VKLSGSGIVGFLVLSLLLLAGPVTAQTTVMPVGDSITQGVGGECSYRRPLSQMLIENMCNVTFVGSRNSAGGNQSTATEACAPQNNPHEAISGFRAEQILTNIGARVNTYQPDVVLLHIGSNRPSQFPAIQQRQSRHVC